MNEQSILKEKYKIEAELTLEERIEAEITARMRIDNLIKLGQQKKADEIDRIFRKLLAVKLPKRKGEN